MATQGRVLRIAGGSYQVETEDGVLECVLAGRLKQGEGDRVAVGDRVDVEAVPDGGGRIVDVHPRQGKLARRTPTGRREQVIAANIDQVAAVFSVAEPEPDFPMLDRLLVLSELNGLDALVVVNKADLGAPPGLRADAGGEAADPAEGDRARGGGTGDPGEGDRARCGGAPSGFRPYAAAGYDVLATSAVGGRGLEDLRRRLEGRTTVLTGPSGSGKSSLLNALVPGLERRVGEVSRRAGRGTHTTVNAALFPFPGGGYVADTPGLQYVGVWEMEPDELAAAFPEFRPHLGGCRFADCRHLEEPGCEVRRALERGGVAPGRYESYRRLLEEAEEQGREW